MRGSARFRDGHVAAADGERARSGGALSILLGWIVSLAVFLLLLEAGLRVLPVPMAKPVVTINEPDRELGWVKRRNESTPKRTSEYSVTFSINALGLRGDADLTREKPAGAQRVLMVGDSFVLGYTVERDDHFVDLVEKALRADGRNVQVLNGGTEGYSSDQELLWLRKEGLGFQPDVVVVCFYQNDVYWNGQHSYSGLPKPCLTPDGKVEPAVGEPPPPRGWLAKHTSIGGFFDTLATSLNYGREMSVAVGSTAMQRDETVVLKSPPPECALDLCWARTEACVRGFRETCEQAKAKLLLVAIPTREQIEPGAKESYASSHGLAPESIDPDLPSARILAAAQKAGVATLDPRAALREGAKDGAKLYFAQDWHVNPRGSRVLGRAIYERLAQADCLGGAPSASGRAVFDAPPSTRPPVWPFVVGAIWLLLSTIYWRSYRDETAFAAFAKVAGMIGVVVAIVWGFGHLAALLGPRFGRYVALGVVAIVVGWLGWKMLPKLAIMKEVHGAFVRRGDWYMIPLLVAMLTIGGLLVVASSSPFIAPFIYTLF